jgi:hypothetical protein
LAQAFSFKFAASFPFLDLSDKHACCHNHPNGFAWFPQPN